MNQLHVDDVFSDALRTKLVAQVEKAAPARTRRRARLWTGTAVFAGLGLLGGVGATAAGVFVTPGSQRVTPLAAAVIETHTGTATVRIGPAPAGSTGIEMQLHCLSPGTFRYGRGASTTCEQDDIGTSRDWTAYTIPLTPGEENITITTSPDASWKLTAQYVNTEITDWAVNGEGDTYGAQNETGSPDMIAVIATNGTTGYVYRTELEDADGTAAIKTFKSPAEALAWQEARKGKNTSIPVYDSTGKTVVGEFIISSAAVSSGTPDGVTLCTTAPPLGPGETAPCPGHSSTETGYPAIPVPRS